MILDTTVLIDVLRGYAPAQKKIQILEQEYRPLQTTTITVFELFQDMQQLSEEKQHAIKNLLASLQIIPFDSLAAEEAGIIRAKLQQKGNILDPEDCMIAGIVRSHHQTLLTTNVKHFNRIPELQIETYERTF
jgi:tRNA(fMet)-specific endonuclease VapC